MVLQKSRRNRRISRKKSVKNKRVRMMRRRPTRRRSEDGGAGDVILIAHLLYKIGKRRNDASIDKAARLASQAKQARETRETARSISAKTTASHKTPGWGIGMPNPPEERMQDAFNSWGAQNKNISESGVIDTTRFSKFYIFLTEQLASNPKYMYKVDDEYRTTMTATRR